MKTELANQLVKLADIMKFAKDHELNETALWIDKTTERFAKDPTEARLSTMNGAWARGRRLYWKYDNPDRTA